MENLIEKHDDFIEGLWEKDFMEENLIMSEKFKTCDRETLNSMFNELIKDKHILIKENQKQSNTMSAIEYAFEQGYELVKNENKISNINQLLKWYNTDED
jgi:hypothetical protein